MEIKKHCVMVIFGAAFLLRPAAMPWTLENVKILLNGILGGVVLAYAAMCWTSRR